MCDYIKKATWRKSEPIWVSKLKSGRDDALTIKAVLGKTHNQEVTRLEIAHAILALLPDAHVFQHSIEI